MARPILVALLALLLPVPLALAEPPAVAPASAAALALPVPGPVPGDVVTLEVLPGWRTGDGRQMAGLRLTLAPGWKTYWRAPGAAGLPPEVDLDASTGIAGAELHWPVPHVFRQGGARSIGYGGTVTIPVELALRPGGGPVRLAGELDLGVCQDICLPVRLRLSADLPADGKRDPAIVAALVDQPLTAEEAGARATCAVAPTADGLALTLRLDLPPQGGDEAVVVESSDPGLWLSEPQSWRDGGTLVATAEAQSRDGGALALDRSRLRITVLGEGRAVDIQGCEAG